MLAGENRPVSCTLCDTRKEKRYCLAVHGRICPQCCGEQREVRLECPSECVYLQQARQHERPRPMSELDREALFPDVNIEESFLYQHENLLLGLSFALARSARGNRDLMDPDLIAALTALGKTYETLAKSGLHYEAAAPNPVQQAVVDEMKTMLAEFREVERKHSDHTPVRDSDILKGIVFLTRMAHGRTSGRPKSRAFADFLFGQFPAKVPAAGDDAGSRIIVP
jgi:hypothetical protein